jgi:hypothetical protein
MSHSIKYIRKEKGRTYSAHIAGPSPFGNGPFDNRWYFRSRGKGSGSIWTATLTPLPKH